jgi:hypothetical protein
MDLAICTVASDLNRVMNAPTVRPRLGLGTAPVDAQAILDLPGTIALMGAHGGFVFLYHGAGVYSVHSLFLPEGRGAAAVRAGIGALEWMWANTSAKIITTEAPDDNPAAKWLARRVGFRPIGRRVGAWTAPDGSMWDITDYEMTNPGHDGPRTVRGAV